MSAPDAGPTPERSWLRAAVAAVAAHPFAGPPRWRYVLGSGLLAAIVLQGITGIAMAFFYVPSAQQAYGSVWYLQTQVSLGGLVRGMHAWGASAVIVLAALHLVQVFLAGAYRPPRHWNWLSGLGLLGLLMAFGLTGYLLPWDQKGYWATQVATSIMDGVPVVGGALRRLLVGGDEYGTLTLTRFYALHILVLPLALVALLSPHLLLFARHGVTPPEADERGARRSTFWPVQAFYDLVFCAFVVATVITLAATIGPHLDAPADPAGSYDARPEWYFLFLFQLLKFFEGPLVLVGTVILPGLATGFLALLPWLDRAPSRGLWARRAVALPFGALALGVVALTVAAWRQDAGDAAFQAHKLAQADEAAFALAHAPAGFTPAGSIPALDGRRLFDGAGCAGCHVAAGRGTDKGPRLDGYATRGWIRSQITEPDHPDRFGGTPFEGEMPAYDDLPVDELAAYVELVAAQTGLRHDPPVDEALAARGAALFEESECAGCHTLDGEASSAPTLHGWGSDAFIRRVLREPDHEALYGSLNSMPSFADLGEAQVDALIAYLRALGAEPVE